jgi:DNA replication protein DnaC
VSSWISRSNQAQAGQPYRRNKSSEAKSDKLRQEIPELADIDSALHSVAMKIMNAAMTDKIHLEARLDEIKTENDNLLLKRASLLEQNGYPADFDSPKFECLLCSDTGYIGLNFCECVKKQLSTDLYINSGLGKALLTRASIIFAEILQRKRRRRDVRQGKQ